MAKPIEPPILMSRILTFALAASIVVLGTLGFTLIKMAPLERPEVFFLYTPTRSTNVVIEPLNTDSQNKTALENYISGFIREYIIARNTLNPNVNISKTNWNRVVKPWSSSKVFSDFANTNLYKEYTFGDTVARMSCSVNFSSSAKEKPVIALGDDKYYVNFIWICENIGGQTTQKNYKILIRIQSELAKGASGVVNNLGKLSENPLGIQVIQYNIMDGKQDPLNSDVASWAKI